MKLMTEYLRIEKNRDVNIWGLTNFKLKQFLTKDLEFILQVFQVIKPFSLTNL